MVTFQRIGVWQPNFLHARLHSLYIRSPKMYCCSRTINLTRKATFLLTSITILSREHFNELMKTLLKIRQEKDMDVDFARAYSLCSFQSEDVLAAFAGKRQCSGGKLSFVVTSEGNIKACAMDSEIYGNILTGTFSSAIAKMASWQDLKYLPDDCKACT